MATTKQSEQARKIKTIQEISVSASRWDYWYQCRNVRLWYAVLLSMNTEPSIENRALLKTHYPNQYQLYVDRLNILRRRQSTDESIKPLTNLLNGTKSMNQYVSLFGVLDLAKSGNWTGVDLFEKGMSPKQIKALDSSLVCVDDENDLDETATVKKGIGYTMVRYAALVELLERVFSNPDQFESIRTEFFKNGQVSNAKLGLAVASTVAQFASKQKRNSVTGFGAEKNAKEISDAKKHAQSYF